MLKITLRQLEAFVATAEYGSFTKAAAALYLTQSTVSARIQELEQALGAELIVRSARKKQLLTEQGHKTYGAARDILDRARALEGMRCGASANELALGASTVPAQSLLPGLMSGYMQVCPDCRCILKRGDSARIAQLLAAGEVRIGFMGALPEDHMLEYRVLREDKLVLICANNEHYRALKARGVSGTALLNEPMILREETSGTRRAMYEYLERAGLPRGSINAVATMDSPEAVKLSVARGMGVAVTSALAAESEVREGKLIAFELAGEAQRKLYIAWRKDASLTAAESGFIEYALGECAKDR